MAAKGLLFLICVFCTLVALLVFAKTRPASAATQSCVQASFC
jgi:hypothetical protein